MKLMTTLIVSLTLLASCANAPPTDEELASADYGPRPSPDHQSEIRAAMDRVLKDPTSARYRFDAPERDWASSSSEGYLYGWKVDFHVNARNSYGGYAGESYYKAFFHRGRLRGVLEPLGTDLWGHVAWQPVVVVEPASSPPR